MLLNFLHLLAPPPFPRNLLIPELDIEKQGATRTIGLLTLDRVPSITEKVFPEEKNDTLTKLENSLYMDLDRGFVGWEVNKIQQIL